MKISLQRTYRSKNGNPVFVYKVSANAENLEAFKQAQGEYYKEDDHGSPLWFTTRCVGQTGTLIITTNGNIVPDMSAFDQAASLAAQYGGNFGQTLAENMAKQMLGSSSPAASAPAESEAPKQEQASPEDLGEI
jgi:hypothetical protein